jgi:hypothetical protein
MQSVKKSLNSRQMARTTRKRWREGDTEVWVLKEIRHHGEKGQCVCCRNPRRLRGRRKDRLTIQERKHECSSKDQAQG